MCASCVMLGNHFTSLDLSFLICTMGWNFYLTCMWVVGYKSKAIRMEHRVSAPYSLAMTIGGENVPYSVLSIPSTESKAVHRVDTQWIFVDWNIKQMVGFLSDSLDSKEIKPVHPQGNQPWILIGRSIAEAEATILWTPDAKSLLIGKDPGAGKVWRQEEKGLTKDEMVGRHHRLSVQEMVKDREAWHAAVHGVTKSRTGLRNWTTRPFRQAIQRSSCQLCLKPGLC